jgi:hypothetical protein
VVDEMEDKQEFKMVKGGGCDPINV